MKRRQYGLIDEWDLTFVNHKQARKRWVAYLRFWRRNWWEA
jgi:hypothetical protein